MVTGTGVLLFSGDTATGSTTKLDCSDNQCKNGGMGQDLGVPDSFASFNGQSVSPLGTFIGSASASGSRTIEDDIVTLEGTAGKSEFDLCSIDFVLLTTCTNRSNNHLSYLLLLTLKGFHGIFSSEFGTTVGEGLTGGFLKLGLDDSYVGDVSGGFAQFEGKDTNPLFVFDGFSRSEGLTSVTLDVIRLEGNATANGKYTSGSSSSDGDSSTEGFLELDRETLAFLRGGGSAQFVGTAKDEATGFEFSGTASAEGSYTLGEDGYFLEGTAQANGVSVSGNVTIPFELLDQLVAGLPSSDR